MFIIVNEYINMLIKTIEHLHQQINVSIGSTQTRINSKYLHMLTYFAHLYDLELSDPPGNPLSISTLSAES